MFDFTNDHKTKNGARELDEKDPLRSYRDKFEFPKTKEGEEQLYFAGHSLGLMPKQTRQYIQEELDAWGAYGVEGHFHAKHPWLPYHEFIVNSFAKLVGAKDTEVVPMNTLTVNLHLMLVSFYRPTKTRFKILIENNTFPSDKYAVDSQARFHGLDPSEAIVELRPRSGEMTIREEDLLQQIEDLGDSLALVMLGNCNYLSGQCFDMKTITEKSHQIGALCGFNLAHGAGNLVMNLHDWETDFAVWCSYKYLNSGPGGIAGAYVHEKHFNDATIPRFEGWWGTNKKTRFAMGPDFDPIKSVEAWQLSNPPIFQLASLRSSMQIFDEATLPEIRKKGDFLTGYLEFLIREELPDFIDIVTPTYSSKKQTRGNMLCVKMKNDPRKLVELFKEKGIILDFREPDILRIAPAPLYNNFSDVFNLIQIIKEFVHV